MQQKQILSYNTKRLTLKAASLECIIAELECPAQLTVLLNAEVTPEWPPGEYDENAQKYFREQMTIHGDKIAGWLNWYAVTKPAEGKPAVLIAAGGFMGLPDEYGTVEIGYSVTESYRRQGYAAEIVQALVEIACSNKDVKKIIAKTTLANTNSQKVLAKAGFDSTDGTDWDGNLVFEKVVFTEND